MGLTVEPLCVMSMDDFGFFSEASDAVGAAASSSSGASRVRASAQYDPDQRHDYQPYNEQYNTGAASSIQPLDAHRPRYPPFQQQQQYPHRLSGSDAGSEAASQSYSSNSHGASGQISPLPAKRGSNLACLKCRAIKVKCWKSNPNDPRCARCNRLDLFCEFREHHRGKKLEKVIADENRHVILTPELLRRARHGLLRCSSYPLNMDLASIAVASGDEDAAFVSAPASSSSQAFSSAAVYGAQTYSTVASAGGMAASGSPSPVGVASSVYDDVVQMNVVSWTDACYMFSLFTTQLNPIVALLEPSLHTVQYTREQSPILFSTILSVASRFFRPALHSQCQAAAGAILKFASNRQLCSVDHTQALIVSAIWAAPGDASRSDALAAAVAYAYELGLPFCFQAGMTVASATKPYAPPLPVHLLHAGHQSTTLRVQQRTWIQLCLLELSAQSDARRTSMQKRAELIAPNDYPNARVWYELHHSTMSAYDTRLAYQLDFALSQRSFDRLVVSMQANSSSLVSEQALGSSIETLVVQERDCFVAWFNTYGEESVARYGMDRYSSTEAGFVLLLYRFGRAVQLHSIAASGSQLQERWLATATELALKVLDYFASKILDQDATSSSMLRFSPQYMASGCLAAARWLLPPTTTGTTNAPSLNATRQRARERLGELLRLLAQPQFYPDGNRVATNHEMTGQLDHALRSLMGEAGMVVSPGIATSPKRARAQDYPPTATAAAAQQQAKKPSLHNQTHEWNDEGGQQRKQRRRHGSNASSGMRLDVGSVGSRSGHSETNGSDRGASDRSPLVIADRWRSAAAGGEDATALSVDVTLGEPQWSTALFGMSMGSQQAGSWTPTSEGALSNIAMAPSSISPPASDSSAVFSVSANALPDHLIGLDGSSAPFGYQHAPASMSNPALPLANTPVAAEARAGFDRAYFASGFPTQHYPTTTAAAGGGGGAAMFDASTGVSGYAAQMQAFPLERNHTATQQSYPPAASQSRYSQSHVQQQQADGFAPADGLDASLAIGLGASYEAGSGSGPAQEGGLLASQASRQ